MWQIKRVLTSCTIAVAGACTAALAAAPDDNQWDQCGKEAADLLSNYIKVDTTNPPGNEKLGAEYLADILNKNGIPAQIIPTSDPARSCCYARLKGSGKKKAIVLLNHIDVVPAQAKDWKYPPFSGEIHDGELWGRGTLDMKNTGIMELESMLMLKRNNIKLDRDIIFLATPDEEAGAVAGAKWFKEHNADLVKDAEFLINEGADIECDEKGKTLYWGVDVAEKSVLWLQVKATGHAGHGSMPYYDAAPNKLVRALTKLVNSPVHFTILPVVQQYFTAIADQAPPELHDAYKDLNTAVQDPKIVKLLLEDHLRSAMLRNTVSLTVLKAGYKTNVIPGEATAELDCRLLPDVKPADFIAEVKKILDDPSIEVTQLEWESAIPSSADSDLFRAIQAVAADEKANVPVVPVVVGWFTDSHWFRELGITSYGFEPMEFDPEHLATVHGINERIPLDGLTKSVRRCYQVLLKLAQAQ
jgi:acetylornithine deacetylase/succinyl-diaminopimelate desuccinylase-like protein